ncbi:MAG TPA: ABC transporter ATP-binding protein, partial [Candidatus Poseidoniales archaeon]
MVEELIIESTALTKSYGPHVALDSLDIRIERGS